MIKATATLLLLTFLSPAWAHNSLSCEHHLINIAGRHGRTTSAVDSVSPSSAVWLFGEVLPNNLLGAKGLSYLDNGGKLRTMFWASQNLVGRFTDVHHRDAAARILYQRAEKLLAGAQTLEKIDGTESDRLLAQAAELSDFASKLGGSSSPRLSRHLEARHLAGIHGFQFSGQYDGHADAFKILNFDVSSSLTAALARAIRDGEIDMTREWLRDLGRHIRAVHEKIHPAMRGYRSIRVNAELYRLMTRGARDIVNGELAGTGLHITTL